MHSEASTQSDSALLESWCERRSESAFAELVRKYERLVTGAAMRRAGDMEVARDVAQQVFAMLAAKARLLVGRTSIAGWLYYAATHMAAQLRRSDTRRLARQTAAVNSGQDARDDHWGILEETLSELSSADRESLLLHYFQDMSYAEMAMELGVSETAARKRVSRGVQSLARALRKHGLGSPKALLAGAAALQMTYPAQSALVANAIVGTSISTPAPLIFYAIMSHSTVKIAICAAALAFLPLGYGWRANANLRTDLAQKLQQRASPTQPTLQAIEGDAALSEMRTEIARIQVATKAVQARVGELDRFRERAKDELVVSMGPIESMASQMATQVRRLAEVQEKRLHHKPGSAESKEWEALMQEASAGLPEMLNISRQIPQLEQTPAKAARFYAALIAELAGLDEKMRAQFEPHLAAWVAQLQRDSLAFPQRPAEPKDAIAGWDKRRIAAMQEIDYELQALVPAEKVAQTSLLAALLIDPDDPSVGEAFDLITGKKQ